MKQVTHRRSTVKSAVATFEGLKSLPASAVILDASGTIVAANDTWKEFGRRNGLRIARSAIGSNYLQYCRSSAPQLRRFAKELKALLAGQLDLLTFIYPCNSPTRKRWFSLIGLPLSLDHPAGVALLHVNLTDMLPISTSTRGTRAKGQRREYARLATDLKAISGAVERSVLETVSSQLGAMFTGSRQVAAREKGDQKSLVRSRLSKRQMEVLRLLGEGKTNKEMARELFLSPNTVKLHVSAILQRLKLRSRTHAALLSSQLHNQDSSHLVEGGLNRTDSLRQVQQAEQLMRARQNEAISVVEMAESLDISMRALQLAFQRHRQMSPMQFLDSLRLEEIRRRLTLATGPGSVTKIALECGVGHLGRFASRYRQRFGETPSATLRKRQLGT